MSKEMMNALENFENTMFDLHVAVEMANIEEEMNEMKSRFENFFRDREVKWGE